MAPKHLPTGLYLLRNVEAKKYVGHIPPASRVGPQKVVLLPGGTRAPHFHFVKREDGNYVIGVDGLTTIEIEGKIHAMPIPHEDAPIWAVESLHDPHIGSLYIIKTPSRPQGWAVNEEKPYTQVFVDLFEAQNTPDGARFELIPIEKEETSTA